MAIHDGGFGVEGPQKRSDGENVVGGILGGK
jgi:hypothetical protein